MSSQVNLLFELDLLCLVDLGVFRRPRSIRATSSRRQQRLFHVQIVIVSGHSCDAIFLRTILLRVRVRETILAFLVAASCKFIWRCLSNSIYVDLVFSSVRSHKLVNNLICRLRQFFFLLFLNKSVQSIASSLSLLFFNLLLFDLRFGLLYL